MPVPEDMDNGSGDWILSWWAPISFVVGGAITYLGTLLTLRRQFLDHLADDARTQQHLGERLDGMHEENKSRLDRMDRAIERIDDKMDDIRDIALSRYHGPERGH